MRNSPLTFSFTFMLVLVLVLVLVLGYAPSPAHAAGELQSFERCTLIPTDWGDGDSFRVKLPDGSEHTVRLYGVDCLETSIADPSDARRLRAQRRYFGISEHGGAAQASIDLAKSLGQAAALEVKKMLQEPFTVHTAFADARGDGKYQRVYAFITTAGGRDLATQLVESGLGRAFGVYRTTPGGITLDDYAGQLKDAELVAARNGAGIWAHTDWKTLPEERQTERREEAETAIAMGTDKASGPVNINTASRDELMKIPGVGEVTANRIIEKRPYAYPEELLRVQGIGAKTLEKMRPYVAVK